MRGKAIPCLSRLGGIEDNGDDGCDDSAEVSFKRPWSKDSRCNDSLSFRVRCIVHTKGRSSLISTRNLIEDHP